MNLQFIDRENEIKALDSLLRKKTASLVLLYGRRRVGKTRLVQEFMRGRNGLYFYTPNGEEKTILAEFSRAVESEFFQGFRFTDFDTFLNYLEGKCGEGFVLAIDEFQRLSNIDGAVSQLQRHWDEKMSAARCFMILSGSSIGAIRRVALSGDAPLYGRRTATIKVEPLKYLDLLKWFQKYSAEELVEVYGSFGGTPAYLGLVDEDLSVEENIIEKILSKNSPLHEEPEMLLMEEIRTPQRYMDILSAIAQGRNTVTQIADLTGINRDGVITYLKTLEILDLIDRVTPVTEPEAKRGLYEIRDPLFSFWFRFVRLNKRQLELGLERNVWEGIKEEFNQYMGQIFENICREVLVDMAGRNLLPLRAEKIGKWWWKDVEIDAVGLEKKEGKALAVEAKWGQLDYRDSKRLLADLSRKAMRIPGAGEQVLGIMAKKIEDKEKMRGEGFLALDLRDLKRGGFGETRLAVKA